MGKDSNAFKRAVNPEFLKFIDLYKPITFVYLSCFDFNQKFRNVFSLLLWIRCEQEFILDVSGAYLLRKWRQQP